MQNTGLGRGLGQLMEKRPPATGATPPVEAAPAPAVTRGVKLYLNAGARTDSMPAPQPAARPKANPVVVGSLLAADALLCLLAWWMVRSSTGALGWFGWLLAGTAIVLGAWLGVLAVQSARQVSDGD